MLPSASDTPAAASVVWNSQYFSSSADQRLTMSCSSPQSSRLSDASCLAIFWRAISSMPIMAAGSLAGGVEGGGGLGSGLSAFWAVCDDPLQAKGLQNRITR